MVALPAAQKARAEQAAATWGTGRTSHARQAFAPAMASPAESIALAPALATAPIADDEKRSPEVLRLLSAAGAVSRSISTVEEEEPIESADDPAPIIRRVCPLTAEAPLNMAFVIAVTGAALEGLGSIRFELSPASIADHS